MPPGRLNVPTMKMAVMMVHKKVFNNNNNIGNDEKENNFSPPASKTGAGSENQTRDQ